MARTKQTARRARSPIVPTATLFPNSSSSSSHPHEDSTDEDTPPLSPPVQTGSTDNRITVINNSSLTRINLGMDFLEFSTMATVESGNAQEVSLRSFSKCFISLSQAGGVVLKETEDAKWCTWVQEWSTSYGVWAKPGAVLEFCNDPKNPPLSAKEYQSIEKLLLYYIEDSPPSGAQDSIDVWSLITNHLRRNSSTPKELHDLFFKTNQRPTPWNQLYAPVSVKNSYATAIRTALKEGTFEVHAYWRVLDRFPGGNCENITSKYCFSFVNKELDVRAASFVNWDGNPFYSGSYNPSLIDSEKATSANFESLFVGFLNDTTSVSSGGAFDWTCNHWDFISQDREEYNSEWSSQEVLLYIPVRWSPSTHRLFSENTKQMFVGLALVNLCQKKRLPKELLFLIMDHATRYSRDFLKHESGRGSGALVMRLHRETRMGPQLYQYARSVEGDPEFIEPSVAQSKILGELDEIVGIGRPVQWLGVYDHDEEYDGRISRAGMDSRDRGNDRDEFDMREYGYAHPIYLRWSQP